MELGRLTLVAIAGLAVIIAGCAEPSRAPLEAGLASVVGKDIAAVYDDKPYGGGQQTPAHIWLEQPDGRLLFYHLNNDDVTKATGVLFVGDAFPGRMCRGAGGVTPEQVTAGFVHFHLKSAPNWDAGHNNGGNYDTGPTAQGYWLRHIGAIDGSMQMGGESMPIRKGQVFPLMPADQTKLQACPGGAGSEGQTLGQLLAPFYASKPFTGGPSQVNTPEHLWFEQPDGRLLLLHFNQADVSLADGLLFVGDAFPGRFCKGDAGATQGEYDAGYVHFHAKSAPNWDAGHNAAGNYADKGRDGYWLRHIGAIDGSMQMGGQTMTITEGAVFLLMPADIAQVQAC